MILYRLIGGVAVLAAAVGCSLAPGEANGQKVDERPLDVQVERAFPKIEWPDWVTGADTGKVGEIRPLTIGGAGDGTNRIFVARQPGTIHVWPNDPAADKMETFLDIRDRIHFNPPENEEGLLGLAFHPHYAENGEFFVYYTGAYDDQRDRRSVISRFHVDKDNPNRADPTSEEILLVIPDKFWNHNGGTLVFGPDGFLYIGLGDGGDARDPFKNGQNLNELWGKILRIDVDHKDEGLAYAIPKDNPFAGQPDKRGEIWCYGIRNVWRIAFDRETGDLWAGEVGQDTWEEIDIIRRGGNYGWNLREAMHPFGPEGVEARPDLIEPIWEYHHDVGKSITGGNVYRGPGVPELKGAYLYADWVTGQVWALWYDQDAKRVTANRTIVPKGTPVMTFGEDDQGETYFTTQEGGFWRFASPSQGEGK